MAWAIPKLNSIRKGNDPERQKKKWSKKRKWTASGIGFVALTAMVLSQSLFAHAASYVNGTFVLSYGTSLTGGTSGTLNTQQAYTLSATAGSGSATLWEYNLYPAFTTADVTTNKGYLMIEQNQLTQYSLPGGYGNPSFVKSELFDPGTHVWTLSTDTGSSSTGGGSTPPQGSFDWYSFPDVLNVNGMKNNTSFNTKVNNQTEDVYQPQTSLNVTNVPLPQFSATISNQYGGTSTTTLNTSATAFINLNVSSFGSNGGGFFGNDYLAAYWVPSGSTTATDALFSPTGNGGGGLSALPSPGQIATNGAMSSISGYPGGFPGQYQTIGDSASALAADSPGLFEIQSPSTAGTYKLVIYLIDGVQRYDAQIASFSVLSSAPQNTCSTPIAFPQGASITTAAGAFSQKVLLTGTPNDTLTIDCNPPDFFIVNGQQVQSIQVKLDANGNGSVTVYK